MEKASKGFIVMVVPSPVIPGTLYKSLPSHEICSHMALEVTDGPYVAATAIIHRHVISLAMCIERDWPQIV